MDNHLVFYDGDCGLCHRSIRLFCKLDKNHLFLFAPLKGDTAKKYTLPQVDSIILLENFKTPFVKGQAIFRIISLLYPFCSFLNYTPDWLANPVYDFIARHRSRLFQKPSCQIPEDLDKSRFLN